MNTPPPRPPSNWWIWLLTAGVVIGYPVSAFIYYPLLLQTGTLPTDADSIGIPMGYSVILAGVASPFVALVTYVCTRRRSSRLALLAWRAEKPILSVVVSTVFLVPVLLISYDVAWIFLRPDRMIIDTAWAPHEVLIATWLLSLRASCLGRFWKVESFGDTALWSDGPSSIIDPST